MRVLVVEDDLMIGESLSEALQDEAYTVDWVKDGRQAILTLRVQPYDIILLDLGLPEIDGMGVLIAIRYDELLLWCIMRWYVLQTIQLKQVRMRQKFIGFQ